MTGESSHDQCYVLIHDLNELVIVTIVSMNVPSFFQVCVDLGVHSKERFFNVFSRNTINIFRVGTSKIGLFQGRS